MGSFSVGTDGWERRRRRMMGGRARSTENMTCLSGMEVEVNGGAIDDVDVRGLCDRTTWLASLVGEEEYTALTMRAHRL